MIFKGQKMTRRSFFSTLAAAIVAAKVTRADDAKRVSALTWQFSSEMKALRLLLHGNEAIVTPEQATLFAQREYEGWHRSGMVSCDETHVQRVDHVEIHRRFRSVGRTRPLVLSYRS